MSSSFRPILALKTGLLSRCIRSSECVKTSCSLTSQLREGIDVVAMTHEVYTHGHHESVLRRHTWRTAENSAGYLLAVLRPGLDLLDVGCGPGTITVDLAARVAPGRVLGLDPAAGVVDEAR